MKESRLGKKFSAMLLVIIIGSTIANRYVHDRDLGWVFLANEGFLLGVWIGIAGYDYWLRRQG